MKIAKTSEMNKTILRFKPQASIEKKILVLSRYLSGYYNSIEELIKEEKVPEVWLYQWRQEYNAKFYQHFSEDKNCDFAKPIERFNNLAVIPARGGSKGLPKKAVRLLEGKPLIAYTIEACLSSKYLDRTIVSTDDREIAEVAKHYGAEVPFLRPRLLAGDKTDLSHAIVHATTYLEMVENYWYDYLFKLIPTYPLRDSSDIDEAFLDYYYSDYRSLLSADEIPAAKNRYFKIKGTKLVPLDIRARGNGRVYRQSGFIYIIGRRPNYHLPLSEYESRFGSPKMGKAYIVESSKAVDIDTEEDLFFCQNIIQRQKLQKLEIENLANRLAKLTPLNQTQPLGAIKSSILCVLKIENDGQIYEIQEMPSLCHPIVECVKSNIFCKIMLVGDFIDIEPLSKWAGLGFLYCRQAFRKDSLPKAAILRKIEKLSGLTFQHVCVVDARRPLVGQGAIKKFIQAYSKHNFAATAISTAPEVHPFWCKTIIDNRIERAFNTPPNGMRQTLPELAIKDNALVAARSSQLVKGPLKFGHFVNMSCHEVRKLRTYTDFAKIRATLDLGKR